jgi:hypothetical protein
MVLAKDSFIPGFTEQLEGAKAGEKRQVHLTLRRISSYWNWSTDTWISTWRSLR